MRKTSLNYFHLRQTLMIALLGLCWMAYGQELKIIKVNSSQYPVIKATYVATGMNGRKITDARPSDFSIKETSNPCKIIEVTNPKEVAVPASIILVVDVSLSMTGQRLALAKQAAKTFIDQIPLESSEVAILSFSSEAYVNCDFTQNRDRLFEAIETLTPIGGTSYNKAFLNENAGALSIIDGGRNKRSVIFLTDGLSRADASEVIAKALQKKTSIYNITLELPMPDILRDISIKTGGKYYEAIADIEQLDGIYSNIFQSLEIAKYGTVTWLALNDCQKAKNTSVTFRGKQLDISYEIPKEKVGFLELDPNILSFGNTMPGSSKNLSFDIIAHNIPFSITDIEIPGKTPFSLSDSAGTSMFLEPEHVKNINLTFAPKDSKIASAKLFVKSKECPPKSLSLLGGSDELLRLVCPKGGEKLVVGMDTSIQWEGVKKEKNIALSYRTNPASPWKTIDVGKNHYYHWPTPNDTGSRVQVKLSPWADGSGALYLTSTMPNQRSILRNASISNDGTKALSIDRNSNIRIWDLQSGKMLTIFESFRSIAAWFCNDDKNIISFSKDETLVWSTQSNKLTDRQPSANKTIFTAQPAPDGSEKLIPCSILKDMANTYKLWMPGLNKTAFIFEKEYIVAASLTPDGTKALTLSSDNVLKIWDIRNGKSITSSYQPRGAISFIISPNGKTAMVIGPGTITMIDMRGGSELFHFQQSRYKRFSNSGDILVADLYGYNSAFLDSYTGKMLVNVGNINFYKWLSNGYNVLYFKNDSITIMDIKKGRRLFQVYKPGTTDISASDDDKKVLAVLKSNVIEVFDVEKNARITRIDDIDGDIRSATFSPDGKSILVLMANNSMQYWSAGGSKQVKEVVSGYFSIISPKPKVKKLIKFNNQYINQPRELVVGDFITNPTGYPLEIRKIEIVRENSSDFELVSQSTNIKLVPTGKIAGEFRFTPSDLGIRKTWIRSCTQTDTFYTELTGIGVENDIVTASSDIHFGRLNILEYRDTLASVLINKGKGPITINSIASAGPDRQQFKYLGDKKPVVLKPTDSLMVKVRFAPKYRGKTSGTLKLAIQGMNEPMYINLSGTGLAAKEVWVSGRTLDGNNATPISATVYCTDLASCGVLKKLETSSDGKFSIKINTDRNYGITAEKANCLSTSENIDAREALLTDTIHRDIYLIGLKSGASIRLNCIFFEFAKATLLPTSRTDLNRVVELLNSRKNISVELQGHTDSIGNDQNNMTLSLQRANAVRNYLIQQKIAPARLTVKGFGRQKPVAPNKTEEGRQLNRRVELKITQF